MLKYNEVNYPPLIEVGACNYPVVKMLLKKQKKNILTKAIIYTTYLSKKKQGRFINDGCKCIDCKLKV